MTFFDSLNLVPPFILKHQKLHFFMKKDKFDAIETFLKGTWQFFRNISNMFSPNLYKCICHILKRKSHLKEVFFFNEQRRFILIVPCLQLHWESFTFFQIKKKMHSTSFFLNLTSFQSLSNNGGYVLK